jgi:hypothetical protein
MTKRKKKVRKSKGFCAAIGDNVVYVKNWAEAYKIRDERERAKFGHR